MFSIQRVAGRCLLLLAAGVLLGGAGPQPQKADTKPVAVQKQVDAAPRKPPPKPVQAEDPPTPAGYYDHCDRGDDKRKSDLCAQWKAADAARDASKSTFWFGAGQLVIGIVGTFAVVLSLLATRDAVKESAKANKGAEKALENSARATAAAEKALTHVEAAFVFMEGYEHEAVWDDDRDLVGYRVYARWKNSGSTPAKKVRSYVTMHRGAELPDDFAFPDGPDPETPRLERRRNIIFIGPQMTAKEAELYVGRTEDTIGHDVMFGFIYGWIEYDDVFTAKRRRTEFCHRFEIVEVPDGTSGRMTSGQLVFIPYGPFNGVDEDCFSKPTTQGAPVA